MGSLRPVYIFFQIYVFLCRSFQFCHSCPLILEETKAFRWKGRVLWADCWSFPDSHPEFFEPTIFFTCTKILVFEYRLAIYKKSLYIYTYTYSHIHTYILTWSSLCLSDNGFIFQVRKLRHGDLALPEIDQLWSKDGGVRAEALSGSACESCILIDLLWCKPFLSGFPSNLFVFWHILPSSTSTSSTHVYGSCLLIHFLLSGVWIVYPFQIYFWKKFLHFFKSVRDILMVQFNFMV